MPTETCEPPPEHRFQRCYGCFTFESAAGFAYFMWRQNLRRPHIWKRNGMWEVGWRYVGPAVPPQDAGE